MVGAGAWARAAAAPVASCHQHDIIVHHHRRRRAEAALSIKQNIEKTGSSGSQLQAEGVDLRGPCSAVQRQLGRGMAGCDA